MTAETLPKQEFTPAVTKLAVTAFEHVRESSQSNEPSISVQEQGILVKEEVDRLRRTHLTMVAEDQQLPRQVSFDDSVTQESQRIDIIDASSLDRQE